MKYSQSLKLIFILCLAIIPCNLYSQSSITSEEQAMSYLDKNYYDLEKIEGIYSVDINFERPVMYCEPCSYKRYTSKNFDKVVIFKSNGRFYQYSLSKGKTTGTFISKTQDQSSYSLEYSYKIEGINDQIRLSDITIDYVHVFDDGFQIPTTGEIKRIRNFFGYEISRNLDINCGDFVSPVDEFICYTYDVTYKFTKIFPSKNYTPRPQYEYGTGFVVNSSPHSVILTNYHVIKDYQENRFSGKDIELKIVLQDRFSQLKEYNGAIVWTDPLNDLASVMIIDTSFKGFGKIPYRIRGGGNLGQNVFALGYPLQDVMGHNIKLSSGMITGTTGISDIDNAYTLDLNLNPGNSGGPLFNNSGDVIGIVSARLSDKAMGLKVENVSYAIKIEKFLSAQSNKIKTEATINVLKDLPLEQKIMKIKPFVVLIKVRGKY